MCLKSFSTLYFPSNKLRVTRSRCSNELYKRFRQKVLHTTISSLFLYSPSQPHPTFLVPIPFYSLHLLLSISSTILVMQNNIESKKLIIVLTHFSDLFPPFLYTYISKASCGNCSPPSRLLKTNYNHPLNHPLHLHPSHSICNVSFLKKFPLFQDLPPCVLPKSMAHTIAWYSWHISLNH